MVGEKGLDLEQGEARAVRLGRIAGHVLLLLRICGSTETRRVRTETQAHAGNGRVVAGCAHACKCVGGMCSASVGGMCAAAWVHVSALARLCERGRVLMRVLRDGS